MYTIDDEKSPKHRSNKDTRKWCRGREGVKHKLKFESDNSWGYRWRWVEAKCKNCGKVLRSYSLGELLLQAEMNITKCTEADALKKFLNLISKHVRLDSQGRIIK